MDYDKLDRIKQLEYVNRAEQLILAGYSLNFDETVEDVARKLYNAIRNVLIQ